MLFSEGMESWVKKGGKESGKRKKHPFPKIVFIVILEMMNLKCLAMEKHEELGLLFSVF